MTVEEICQMHGYNYTLHLVKTEDGYINQVFRVNTGGELENNRRPAVLLVHGLIDSGDTWVTNTKEKAQAFVLADDGYDVWLANTRGNKNSRMHESLDSDKDIEYWDHSYALNIGRYDLPAFIEFAKQVSNVQNMTVIAHSQGS
jgi:lysosomal acid lipase/cholesteryl ester hydrolase